MNFSVSAYWNHLKLSSKERIPENNLEMSYCKNKKCILKRKRKELEIKYKSTKMVHTITDALKSLRLCDSLRKAAGGNIPSGE